MMNKVEYSALKYYNSLLSEECLYVGMLFYNVTTGQRNFKHISNFKRLQAFDDDIDIEFAKQYLKGIKNQMENDLFDNEKFDFAKTIKPFVNEFRFSKINSIETDEHEDYIDNLTKVYLKYDLHKSKRLTEDEERKVIKKVLNSNNIELSSPSISGSYDEEINFDYIIDDIAVKYFSLKDKNPKRVIPSAKQWAFTAGELEKNKKVIFLYDEVDHDNSDMNTVLNILRKNGEVFQVQEGLNYVMQKLS